MKTNRCVLRRLILGMSMEDAMSKFDSFDSRIALHFAHQRHNRGILHELHVAQRLRDGMSSERRCHIRRFTKPSVQGFQAYLKRSSDDYIIVELWDDNKVCTLKDFEGVDKHSDRSFKHQNIDAKGSAHIVPINTKLVLERKNFLDVKAHVISAMSETFKSVKQKALTELNQRRRSCALTTERQDPSTSLLLAEVSEPNDLRKKNLSHSIPLLDSVKIRMPICVRKDKAVLNAFNSSLLSFAAPESDISYSLWISGRLLADEDLITDFPYHLARYIVSQESDVTHSQLPSVGVEVYFSPDLFRLNKDIGRKGIGKLRGFIGKIMMKQHEPKPISTSLLFNTSESERSLFNLYSPGTKEEVQIPWAYPMSGKVSTMTSITSNVEKDKEELNDEKKRESILSVWKTWGHLIKDLHVYGDRAFLYVSIDRQKEKKENDEYIMESKLPRKSKEHTASEPNRTKRATKLMLPSPKERVCKEDISSLIPFSVDFVVLECLLERKGLPYNIVAEDILASLTEMQTEALNMLRLSVMNEIEGSESDTMAFSPILYVPKIVVSNAGVIEDQTHSFQRIRIRGSCLAHVEALACSLDETHSLRNVGQKGFYLPTNLCSQKPPNLSYSRSHPSQPFALTTSSHSRAYETTNGSSSALQKVNIFRKHKYLEPYSCANASNDEENFLKENYYRLSNIEVVFHAHVDPEDAISAASNTGSADFVEYLIDTTKKFPNDDPKYKNEFRAKANELSMMSISHSTKTKSKHNRNSFQHLCTSPQKAFEYMCKSIEAQSVLHDLSVGDCEGYMYAINLTNIPSADANTLTKQAVHSLLKKGFINYFGPSRFASYTTMNMHPGLHLLKGEFQAAAKIIVQQFYLDRAISNEKRQTGLPFSKSFTAKRIHYNAQNSKKDYGSLSVDKHGTVLQKVLSNALQASQILSQKEAGNAYMSGQSQKDNDGVKNTFWVDNDPCAEAFINLIGPNVCLMLISEFLSFIWNDIVNQRMQRYGTFAILPGDLVRKHPHASSHSLCYNELHYVSEKDIQSGKYNHWDVVLPVPGANIQLPDNHTSDIYIVTLERFGISFNPEMKQWDCFYPRTSSFEEGDTSLSYCADFFINSSLPTKCSFGVLTSSFKQIDELNDNSGFCKSIAPFRKTSRIANGAMTLPPLQRAQPPAPSKPHDNHVLTLSRLHQEKGNLLRLLIKASYRNPLYNTANTLSWKLVNANTFSLHQKWGCSIAQRFPNLYPSNSQTFNEKSNNASTNKEKIQLNRKEHENKPAVATSVYSLPTKYKMFSGICLPSTSDVFSKQQSYFYTSRRQRSASLSSSSACSLTWNNNACLMLRFTLPVGVYPSMLLRELTKLDVNTPDVVNICKGPQEHQLKSPDELANGQYDTYRKLLAKIRQRRLRTDQPRALSLALLHQHIFRCGGIRNSLIPTLRSYDSISLHK